MTCSNGNLFLLYNIQGFIYRCCCRMKRLTPYISTSYWFFFYKKILWYYILPLFAVAFRKVFFKLLKCSERLRTPERQDRRLRLMVVRNHFTTSTKQVVYGKWVSSGINIWAVFWRIRRYSYSWTRDRHIVVFSGRSNSVWALMKVTW